MMRTILIAALMLVSLPAVSAIDAYPFPNEELEARYATLINELRCPQCLNTNLAGSDAMIARDLRREVHRLLLEGKSNQEIINFMHARYGDFILYKPRVTAGTALLWFGPFVLLGIGAIVAGGVVYRGQKKKDPALDDDEAARLNELLDRK